MQTNKLKTYAPKAAFGLTAMEIKPNRDEGELVIIEGEAYWFNRFAAIRFMELHGYLDHSFRVLSHPAGGALPEILEQAQHVELPGLDHERVIALKMDGTQDEALYRDLLLAQCRALHQAMPFLLEPVDDETELLLPDRLLQTDSLIRELVTAIPETDWQEIEIIGWLYQFYISEKKDQVIGKVVKSEDTPAAPRLFTPNFPSTHYTLTSSACRHPSKSASTRSKPSCPRSCTASGKATRSSSSKESTRLPDCSGRSRRAVAPARLVVPAAG